jgi:hypothetical protein
MVKSRYPPKTAQHDRSPSPRLKVSRFYRRSGGIPRTEDPINLARHDKIVLVQSLDLLGAQRDGRVTPAEADVGMMDLRFQVNLADRRGELSSRRSLFG